MWDIVLYGGVTGAIFLLMIISLVVRDTDFIRNRPADFIIELIFVSLIPALLMVFVFAKTRRLDSRQTLVWFLSILFKLMIFHILLQISGFYTHVFRA